MKRLVFLALTAEGAATARRAMALIGGELHAPPPISADVPVPKFASHLRQLFREERPIVGICAAGILIRVLAPLLSGKRDDPPVLAISEDGASVVPLLSGHGGANRLASEIAAALGGHAAITTTGDTRFGVALDAPPEGWTLANPTDAKAVMAALLSGETAKIKGAIPWLREATIPLVDDGSIRLVGSVKASDASAEAGHSKALIYHPKTLAVGIGCERGIEPEEVLALVKEALAENDLPPASVACVVSIDLKADEAAVLAAAAHLGVPARFFTATELEAETPRLANPSEVVFREVGCHGVAEGAALAAAGPEGTLVVAKTKSRRATVAIAEAAYIIDPARTGRARGRLAIVGIGPGSRDWLTPEARRLLGEADAAVGYFLYLDLVGDLLEDAERFDSDLGREEDRARKALALAGEGRSVVLVSSGDAGIYAMATLVFECLGDPALPDAARRAEVVVAPGISAMQAAAARAGAPLGHDFCAISLSDLLTPWETIVARLEAAAKADFVVALYNPVSQRRRMQLAEARTILLAHRPLSTPVVLARNLGRDGESVRTVTLATLDVEEVDMLTIVIVGASTTQEVLAGGKTWIYTPRGYDKKRAEQ